MKSYCKAFARALRPRKKLSVAEWADANRVLSQKSSSEPGRWRTSRAPHTKEPMECLSASSPVQRIVLMFAAQTSKSEIGLNWLGYIMEHAPAPALVVLPTLEVRKRWVRQRLGPMLTETPALAEIFDAKRARDASNSEDIKDFPGGMLVIGGANSPASLSSMPIRYVLCDEVDRFPWEAGDEGDPLGLVDERTKTFPNRKVLLVSTPTIKDSSRIESEYLRSDQRRYHVPCPHCDEYQILKWSNLKWDEDLDSAWYVCEHCGAEFDESRKTSMLSRGKWIPEYPERDVRGYAINGLYAPVGLGFKWIELARQWIAAQGDHTKLKRFINTTLGEVWEDQSSNLTTHDLSMRMENIDQRKIPIGCLALTVGVDTQDSWLELTLLGWGYKNHWIIERLKIHGDTMLSSVWDQLEIYLNKQLINQNNMPMRIDAAAIDIRGHRGEQVKDFINRKSLKIPVYAVQGSTIRMSKAISVTPSYPTKTNKGKIIRSAFAIWNVGTEYCKDFIFGALASDGNLSAEERVFRFPSGLEDEYFDGLLSEVFDHEKNKYVPRVGARYKRNEPLDTLVYAWAIGHHKNVLIGLTRKGEKNPAYWIRRSGLLETGVGVGVIEIPEKAIDELPIITEQPTIVRQPRSYPKNNTRGRFSVGSFRDRFRGI